MSCCCEINQPNDCVGQGPCQPCIACDGTDYPANLLVAPAVGCFPESWVLQSVTAVGFACICLYGCRRASNYSASLYISPGPTGNIVADLAFYDGRVGIITAGYTTSNWNCCGTNVMMLNEHNCASAPPTRTVTPIGGCNCTHLGPWCGRRPVLLRCLIQDALPYSEFNGLVIPCFHRFFGGPNWFGTRAIGNTRIEASLVCNNSRPPVVRWGTTVRVYVRDEVPLVGTDVDSLLTTSVCDPVYHDSSIFPIQGGGQIRTIWTE